MIEQLTNELSEHEYHTVKQQYQSAITDEKAFMDIIDEREEVTLEDRENVARATAMKEALQGELRILEQKYLEGMAILETSKIRMQRKERYDKEAAKDVLTYFSSDRYVDLVRSSTTEEQLKGITQFLGCFVRGFNALKKNNADELSGASESEMKKAVRKDEYSKYRRIRSLQRFISNVCVPISDFGDALRYNRKLEPPPTPSFYCRDMADEFVDYEQFKNVDQVLHAAKLVIATELSMEPYIREKSRKLYRERASISTRPTPKGVATINPFHDLFGLHYLNRKPLVDFLYGADLTMFVKLTEAQGNGLITITIHPPEVKQVGTDDRVTDIQLFLQTGMPLVEQFFPSLPISEDRHAMFRPSWDALRLEVLQTCIETILLPSLEVECRRELLSTARNALIKEVANNFATYLKIGPYNMDIADRDSREMYRKLLLSCPKRSNYPTVGVVYLQPDADSIMSYVYLNKDGVMRTHDSLPKKAANQRQSRLKKNLLETRPNLIIINASGGQQAKALSITIAKQLIPTISAELAQSSRYVGDLDEEDEDQGINYQPQVRFSIRLFHSRSLLSSSF